MNLIGLIVSFIGSVILVMVAKDTLVVDAGELPITAAIGKKTQILRTMKFGFALQAAGFLLQSFSIICQNP